MSSGYKPVIGLILLILAPWVLMFFLTHCIVGQNIGSSMPVWCDELVYWHEVWSFLQKGFDHGYYSFSELLPKLGTFGTHGVGTVAIYAVFAKFFGWNYNAILMANAFLISCSFFVLWKALKLSFEKSIIIAAIYFSFAPIILYSAVSMSDLMNFSLLIVYASLLFSILVSEEIKKTQLLVFLFFVSAISFVRIIYVVLFFPLCFVFAHRANRFKIVLLFVFLLFLAVGLYLFSSLFITPYPLAFLYELFACKGDMLIPFFLNHLLDNCVAFFNVFEVDIVQVFGRYLYFGFVLFCFVKTNIISRKPIDNNYLVLFFILVVPFLVVLLAYDVWDWRDYRVLSPFLFIVLLYLSISNFKSFYIILSINLLGIAVLFYSGVYVAQFADENRYREFEKMPISRSISYTESAKTQFENTVIVNSFDRDLILSIPAGIGVSYSELFYDRFQSKYLLVNHKLDLKSYGLIDSTGSYYLYVKKLK